MHINNSTITVVGNFSPVAIRRDIQKRGGQAVREITPDTNYVLIGKQLTDDDNQTVKEATQLGVPCITLEEYSNQIPDNLETE